MFSTSRAVDHSPISAMRVLRAALGRRGLAKMSVATAAIVLAAVLTNAPAFLISWFIDRVDSAGQLSLDIITPLVGALAAAVLVREMLDYLRKWMVESSAVELHRQEFVSLVQRLLNARVDAVRDDHASANVTRIERGIIGLIKLQKVIFLEFGPQLATAIVAVSMAVWAHWVLGLAMLLVFACNAAITLAQIRSQKGIRVDLETKRRNVNGRVGELLVNLDSVRAAGASVAELGTFATGAETLRKTELKHHLAMMRFDAVKNGVEALGLVVVVGTAFLLLNFGHITQGGVLLLAMLYLRATVPLQMLHRILDESHEAAIMVGEAAVLRDLERDPGLDGREPVPVTLFGDPVVTLTALSVDRVGQGRVLHVLSDCSLTVRPGEFIGFKGETGSGKSTLLHVVLGIIPDYCGSARVLGTEVRLADKDQLYRSIAYVGQKPFLKAGSLRDNLLIGVQHPPTDDQLIRSLTLAGLPLEGRRWADGLATRIAEGGSGLAGGECQRIALARLFLSEAKLILLDEATSALDELTEQHVLSNLREHARGRTVLMIAHRPSALNWADRLVTVRHGQLDAQVQSTLPLQGARSRPTLAAHTLGVRVDRHERGGSHAPAPVPPATPADSV